MTRSFWPQRITNRGPFMTRVRVSITKYLSCYLIYFLVSGDNKYSYNNGESWLHVINQLHVARIKL